MDDIDPTPKRMPEPGLEDTQQIEDIELTPRCFPNLYSTMPTLFNDIDATPRRSAETGSPQSRVDQTNNNYPTRFKRRQGPRLIGPGYRNGFIPLSPLAELEQLELRQQTTQEVSRKPEKQRGTEKPHIPDIHGPRRLAKRRSRRVVKKGLTCLLLLLILGGGFAYGCYLIELNILGPLSQFFHPLQGDNESAIDGRTWNLLLMGSDNDSKFSYPNLLTQVMMVVRVDPINNSVYMVSIPRDSWVHVPGRTGLHKIDQAFYLGSIPHHSFDDGVRAARATIEQDYGISIDRYAWIGLDGFASVINTLGGVDIDITHPILDDTYPDDTGTNGNNPYAIKRVFLQPGPQHLDGSDTLEFVRSRHADLVGDIGRTQRQQKVLTTLKQKLNLPGTFNHLGEILNDLKGKIYTDLSQEELISFANFSRNLPAEAMQRLTLGPGTGKQNYGQLTQVNDPGLGETQDVLLPKCANIQPVINTIFGLGDVLSCQVNGP